MANVNGFDYQARTEPFAVILGPRTTLSLDVAMRDQSARFIATVPPQIARPASDVSIGGWTTDSGATTGLAAAIDEVAANDADYIRSPLSPVSANAVRLQLGTLSDPAVSAGHVIRYRIGKDAAGGDTITITARLYDGATLIATDIGRAAPDAFTTYEWTLTGAEADAIVNYSNLRLDFSAITT